MTADVPDAVLRSVLSIVPAPRPPADRPCGCASCCEDRDRERNRWDWRALDDAVRAAQQLKARQR